MMKSQLEKRLDIIESALYNLYSVVLNDKKLTKTQHKNSINFLNLCDDEKIRSLAKETESLVNFRSADEKQSIIEKQKEKINNLTSKLRKFKLISIVAILCLLSIIAGISFTQTQYRKAGQKSLGRIMFERVVQ